MRTTLTLEPDVARMLKDAAHRTRRPFKEVLNAAVRAGLTGGRQPAAAPEFVLEATPLRLRAGIDPHRLNSLPDELEAEEFLRKAGA
jgi:hypothetical protein